jgi:hypothetical protein
LFNRRQFYFVIGPIPVFLCQGRGLTLAPAVLPIVFVAMAFSTLSTKAGWNSWRLFRT